MGTLVYGLNEWYTGGQNGDGEITPGDAVLVRTGHGSRFVSSAPPLLRARRSPCFEEDHSPDARERHKRRRLAVHHRRCPHQAEAALPLMLNGSEH
jgi:hypothetical protein